MNNSTVQIISSLSLAARIIRRILYCGCIGLGSCFMLLGFCGVCYGFFFAQSIPLYFLLLLGLLGLFILYRGWVGNKAFKIMPLPENDDSWNVYHSYPVSFWSYIHRAFFNPKDVGLTVGITIFFILIATINIIFEGKEIAYYNTYFVICIIVLVWKAVIFYYHWKSWHIIWNEGPLLTKLSSEGISFVMPYNMSEEDEVIFADEENFEAWDDNNHCLMTDHIDWKDIQRVEFFRTYMKLCSFWRSWYVFYDTNCKQESMLRQIVALNFLRHQEKTTKYTINNIQPLFQQLERLSVSWYFTDEGDYITGDSKMFGEPDVPKDFHYPTTDDNRPMTFVFQINLNDAAGYDTKHLLPSSGMLYFFYDYDGLASEELSAGHINDWWFQKGNNGYFRIIYVDSSRNELRPSYANDSGQRIVFKAEKSLPDYKDINLQLDKYTRAFDVIDILYQSLRTSLNIYDTYDVVKDRIGDYKVMLDDYRAKCLDRLNIVSTDTLIITINARALARIAEEGDNLYKSVSDLILYATGAAACSTADLLMVLNSINNSLDNIKRHINKAYFETWKYIQVRIGYWKAQVYRAKTIKEIVNDAFGRWRGAGYLGY